MEFKNILSISGLGGLFDLQSQRGDGMVVTSLTDGQTRFVSSRKHLFTPLENISIYTDTDSVPLREVFARMKQQQSENPLPAPNDKSEKLKAYLGSIVEDYDREKVYVSDVKKLVRWFGQLEEKGLIEKLLSEAGESASEKPTSEEDTSQEISEESPEQIQNTIEEAPSKGD